MPSDLTISAIGTPAAIPARAPSYQPSPLPSVDPKVPGPPPPSPTLRFDAAAGILVIEFHNDAGEITNSIPTSRQLQAYRSQSEFGPSPAPPPTQPAANGDTATASLAAATPNHVAALGVAISGPASESDIVA